VPALYFAGLAAAGGTVRTLTEGCVMGTLSMSSWVLD
jgi:hypothetical protein